MRLRWIAQATVFLCEGDANDTDFMVLLVEGEVTLENLTLARDKPQTGTVLGPGSLMGNTA